MLAAQSSRFVGMDDGVSGENGEVLRLTGKAHQQNVSRLPICAQHSLQARLAIQRLLKLPISRGAAVSKDIDHAGADLARNVDCHASAVQPGTDQPPLVAKWRSEALPSRR